MHNSGLIRTYVNAERHNDRQKKTGMYNFVFIYLLAGYRASLGLPIIHTFCILNFPKNWSEKWPLR